MVAAFASPVLSVAVDVVRDLDGKDALSGLWHLFTKCKGSLQDGHRLENISWRLWHRELAASAGLRAPDARCATPDRHQPPAAAPLSPISDYGRGFSHEPEPPRSPSPALSAYSSVSAFSARPSSIRSTSSSSIGKIIVDILPEHRLETSPPSRRSSFAAPAEQAAVGPSATVVPSALPTPELEAVAVVYPAVILPAVASPQASLTASVFPRVVIVNPTPHPTPPATPAPGPTHFIAPALPQTHLLPPPRMSSASALQARSPVAARSVPQPTKVVLAAPAPPARATPVLLPPAPIAAAAKVEEQPADHRFFLTQSPDDQSASSQASSSPAPSRVSASESAVLPVAATSPSIVSARSPSSEAESVPGAGPSSVNSNQTHASTASRRAAHAHTRPHQARQASGRARFGARPHPLVQRKAAGTEAQHKAGTKGKFDVGSANSVGSSQRRPSDSVGAASPSPAEPAAAAPPLPSNGKARAVPEVYPAETARPKPAAPARPPLMRAQTGPAAPRVPSAPAVVRQPSKGPVAAARPAIKPLTAAKPPPPAPKQAAPPPARKVVVASSDDYETTEGSGSESGSGSSSDWEDDEDEAPKSKADEARLRAAALEAQRQRELFDKLPKRSYSNLNRTQSGLLSQLLNPDPAALPPGHPARSRSSAHVAPAPPLATSYSAAAIPQLSNVTADGAYRPRGPPADQELEDSSDDEDAGGLSRSLAQQKLAALAQSSKRRRSAPSEPQEQPRADPSPPAPLTTVATAPIPLNHPWNLPAPAPPMTPRTTRRQMLSTELSESLRRNLLWERQVSKTNLLRGGLKPLTAKEPPKPQEPESEEQRRERERAERTKAALARHRSWADDYHHAGW